MQNGSLLFSPEGIGTRKLKLGKKKKKKSRLFTARSLPFRGGRDLLVR